MSSENNPDVAPETTSNTTSQPESNDKNILIEYVMIIKIPSQIIILIKINNIR